MSQAIYRKYRPSTFSDVVGQGHVTKTLENQIKTGHIVHSYIFTGSRGIGKTSIARLLAKSLNCENRKDREYEACNTCSSCQGVNLGNSLNIIEIDAASNTGVDNVRDKIIENVRFAISGGKYKVFIIDEVHMLSTQAFNALLKTLEEPPEHIVFILATTELHKIPATILSRCQRFDFKKLTADEVIERLSGIAKKEKVKIDNKILGRIAYLSEGCLRDAESLFGQLLGLGLKEIKEEDADLVLPRGNISLTLDFLRSLVDKSGYNAMLILNKIKDDGIDYKHFTDNLIEFSRKLLYLKVTGEGDSDLSQDINKILSEMVVKISQSEIIKLLDVIIARRSDLNTLDIPSLPLELAVAEICGDENKNTGIQENKGEIKNKMVYTQPKTTISVVTPISTSLETSMPQSYKYDNLADIVSGWATVLEKIKAYNHSLPFVLSSAKPMSFDGKSIILAVKFKLHQEKIDDPKNRHILTEVLKSVYNKDIILETKLDESLTIDIKEDAGEVDVEFAFS